MNEILNLYDKSNEIPPRERLFEGSVAKTLEFMLLTLFSVFMFICWSETCLTVSFFSDVFKVIYLPELLLYHC